MDLRHSLVPDEVIEQLIKVIPEHHGPNTKEDRGMKQYDYISFMDKLIGDPEQDEEEKEVLRDASKGKGNAQRGPSSPTKVNGLR